MSVLAGPGGRSRGVSLSTYGEEQKNGNDAWNGGADGLPGDIAPIVGVSSGAGLDACMHANGRSCSAC